MQKLTWKDLDEYEKAAAEEQYLCIREDEEQRSRDETNEWFPDPIDPEGVKSCTFIRESFEDGTTTVNVFV